jgi:homoserine dehydrogenase
MDIKQTPEYALAQKVLNKEFAQEIAMGSINEITVEYNLSTIAIVGQNMKHVPGIAGKFFGTLGRSGISVVALAQGASETNISCVISKNDLRKALNVIHDSFFLSPYQELNLFVVGTGTVGNKLLSQIQQQKHTLEEQNKLRINIVGIANSRKALFTREGISLENYQEELETKGIKSSPAIIRNEILKMNIFNAVFVDCTASKEISDLYEELMSRNISVVTANKIATSSSYETYRRLKKTARKAGVKFLFETNVGAGLPIINTMNSLINSGDKIIKLEAVLSGTLNFIFNTLSKDIPFSKAVRMAVDAHYAEPDPRIDLSGLDVIRKLVILSREAGAEVEQNYTPPLKIDLRLSANFGELRDSHFHSGIDIKTNGSVNQPVYAVADGYISRISVSPGGFGRALYIDHPDGHTTVYGHLNAFSPNIAEYAEQKQYELERFRIDLFPTPNELPVKKGEQIALSGNTGSSGGPHLHFEVRDTRTQDPLDVLDFFGNAVVDTQKPDIRGIAFYPVKGKGAINGSNTPLRLTITKNKAGTPLPPGNTISAWGRIGVGVKAYDRMNGQNNIYGIKHVRLFVDEQLVFRSTINRFSFSKTRMLNSFVDFEEVRNRNSYYMKSFVEPGNTLPFYETVNNGFIDIDEERAYRLRYELEDYHGNTLVYPFVVNGIRQPIPPPETCGLVYQLASR